MNISLISNTGIQFFTTDFEIKAEESFIDKDGNFISPLSIKDESGFDIPLVFHESYNIMDDIWTLEMAVNFSGGQIVRLDELRNHRPIPYLYTNASGIECLVDENKIDFNELDVIGDNECYSDYCFAGSITERLTKGTCPLDTIENQWLPMPMFEKDSSGNSVFGPTGWCRMKLVPISKIKNVRRYHIVWAFDTTSIKNDLSGVKPFYYEGEAEKHYSISNDISLLFNFFSPKPYDCEWVDEYIATLIHGNKENTELISAEGEASHFRYIAYYITIISYLQKVGLTPEVTLYTDVEEVKQVDLVLDIGNSRTCGVLFESSDFTKVDMLQLQDLSEPWKVYKKPFDMRLAFHHCKFGEMDIPEQFTWQSFLRIGDEAIKLIYKSRPTNGVAQRTTNYSSPKRYLWDDKQFEGQWDFLTTDDMDNSILNHYINIKGLSEQFDSDGSLRKSKNGGIFSSFSRRSLMTFVLIEILQQANCQINSQTFREKHGDVNIPRKLRNILITCPTAMPKEEQIILRQCAEEAYIALLRCKDPELYYQPYNPDEWKGKIQIIPSVKDLMTPINGPMQQRIKTEWGYDEATCCQLVYLYAEVAQRYLNHCEDFFKLYGHVRKEFIEEDYNRKSLTIGSIDIGAGTTDLMICAYKYDEKGVCKLTPKPLFWDSFYYAGDDILEEIVRAVIIEGQNKSIGQLYEGPIFNAVCSTYMELNDNDFIDALNLIGKITFNNLTESEKTEIKYSYAARETSERIHNFFGKDKALMDYKDRIMRQDFNVQISVPMGLKLLEMLRLERKSTSLKYEDFFNELQPASFILDHFNKHFSITKNGKSYVDFDFKKIIWNFDCECLSKIVVAKIEPLMKQLAIVLNTYNCDIVLLAGKPTSLRAITDLFLKYYPTSPNRLIRLNDYRVGEWYPFADGLGYFKDQKSLVAIGAMIGYLSSNGGINGFHMDMTRMKKDMVSTANYMGLYNSVNQKIVEAALSPEQNTATFEVHGFPLFIGCKQLLSQFYKARPLYAINLADDVDLHTVSLPLKVSVVRNYSQEKETLRIVSAIDALGKPFSTTKLRFGVQSLASEGAYWLDKGEFVLSING